MQVEKEKFEWLTTLSERTAWAMQQNFSDFFFNAMQGKFESLKDVATGALNSISRALSDLSAQWLARPVPSQVWLPGPLFPARAGRHRRIPLAVPCLPWRYSGP